MKRRDANGLRLLLGLALLATVACGPKRIAAPPPLFTPPPPSLFVLLPEDRGRPNAAIVTNPAGSRELVAEYTALRVANGSTAPSGPVPIDPAVVRQIFGAALDVLPGEELVFNLRFTLGTVNLSPESEAQIPSLLQAVRDRRSTILTVTGHTDTTGVSREANYQLGLDRANAVAERLRAAGADPQSIIVRSHGQDDLLVATPANTPQPENRRVEVIVR
jgi:outer membrane protein OmpA-like peptidoglycan-associated protein